MVMMIKFKIEDAYKAFCKYNFKKKIEGSPIYGDKIDKWNNVLNCKDIRDLDEDDLSVFTGKVMTTFGDEYDLKKYLPRILELSWEYKNPYDIYIFYSKLKMATYSQWDSVEKDIIDQFKKDIIIKMLYDSSSLARVQFIDYLAATIEFTNNLDYLVNELKSLDHESKLLHLSELIVNQGENIFYKNRIRGFENVTNNIEVIKQSLSNPNLVKSLENSDVYKANNEETYLVINAIQVLNTILN